MITICLRRFPITRSKPLWFILHTHPYIELDGHIALLVPNEEVHSSFGLHLEERLGTAFHQCKTFGWFL